jgi:hypothetical protein
MNSERQANCCYRIWEALIIDGQISQKIELRLKSVNE